jgi:hypothetical protein
VRSVVAIGVLGLLIAAKATYLDGGPLPSTVVKDEYTFAHLAQWKRTPNGGFRCDLAPADCEELPFSAGPSGAPPNTSRALRRRPGGLRRGRF